jgi:cytochrome c553
MSGQKLVSWRNPWFVTSIGGTFAVLVFSAFVGFIWLPSAQDDALFKGLLNSICSAAGIPRAWLANTSPPVLPSTPVSDVSLTATMLGTPTQASTGRGATLALRCTMCHGARGVSAANTPNLAGQYAESVYKELRDFQSGARVSAVMSPMVVGLSDQDMRDLAAYYAYLPRTSAGPTQRNVPLPGIVATGAPMRNIAPCAACHGGVANKVGAPWLNGQPVAYLSSELNAFATGQRHNDISEQMRNVARQMTPLEINEATRYYAAQR